jgi:hypothetical protein
VESDDGAGWLESPGGAVSAGRADSHVELADNNQLGMRDRRDHELRDALKGSDSRRLFAKVDENDVHFTAEIAVNRPWSV